MRKKQETKTQQRKISKTNIQTKTKQNKIKTQINKIQKETNQ